MLRWQQEFLDYNQSHTITVPFLIYTSIYIDTECQIKGEKEELCAMYCRKCMDSTLGGSTYRTGERVNNEKRGKIQTYTGRGYNA